MANKPTPVRFISKEPVRISFPKFFTKDQLSDSYSCFFLIPKTDKATLTALTGALAEARAEGARTVWGQEIPNASSTIYDGDKPKAQGGEWPEDYKGYMILKASSQYPTQVFDEKKQPIKAAMASGLWAPARSEETPKLMVTLTPMELSSLMARRIRSAMAAAVARSRPGRTTQNSSPPKRPTRSLSLAFF